MSSTNSITIHYCPTCRVGIDAAFSKPLACPSCGQSRKLIRSHEWVLREPVLTGGSAEIPIEMEAVFGRVPAER